MRSLLANLCYRCTSGPRVHRAHLSVPDTFWHTCPTCNRHTLISRRILNQRTFEINDQCTFLIGYLIRNKNQAVALQMTYRTQHPEMYMVQLSLIRCGKIHPLNCYLPSTSILKRYKTW